MLTNQGYDQPAEDDRVDRQPEQPDQPDRSQFVGPPAPPVTPLVPTWGPSEDLMFARKSAGLGQVRNDLDAGNLHPQYASVLLDGLQRDLNQLTLQQQAAQAFKQHNAMQAALGQNAMVRAVEQQDMEHRAQNFPNTIAAHTDATTGEVSQYYQQKNGEWKPVEKRDQVAGDEPGVGPAPPPLAPDGLPYDNQRRQRTVVDQNGVPHYQTIPTATEFAAAQQQAQANPGAMSVQSGQYTDRYQDGQQVSTDRPQPQAAPPGGAHLEEAKRLLPPQPPQFVVGPHGRLVPNPQYTAYHRSVTALALDMWKTDRQTSSQNEHKRQDQARADRQTAAAEQKAQHDTLSKDIDTAYKQRAAEWQAGNMSAEGKKQVIPEDVRKNLQSKAAEDAVQKHVGLHGTPTDKSPPVVQEVWKRLHPNETPEGGHLDGPPAQQQPQGQPVQPPASTVQPLPKDKYTDAEIKDELAKRERAAAIQAEQRRIKESGRGFVR